MSFFSNKELYKVFMGACFSKKIPPLNMTTEASGNDCGHCCTDDECTSSCCIILHSDKKEKTRIKNSRIKNI